MRPLHEQFLETVKAERTRLLATRRGFLAGGAKLAAGGALALGAVNAPAFSRSSALAQDFESDIDVLNYALTLEHLEFAFYRDNVDLYDLGLDPFGNSVNEYLALVRDHEGAHVETLTQVITDLGGEPVVEATYDFGVVDAPTFLATAAALENTGVSAYDGAGAAIENADLLTAAGTIVAVEARHASYLNLLVAEIPFPAAFETPLTTDEVLAIAGPFFVTADSEVETEAGDDTTTDEDADTDTETDTDTEGDDDATPAA